jgi:glutamine cyclotransferase
MRRLSTIACAFVLAFPLLLACVMPVTRGAAHPPSRLPSPTPTPTPPPTYTYEIRKSYRHDSSAYTQGLVIHDGVLFESTGLYGSSTLRRVDLKTGRVLKRLDVPADYFAEGLTLFEGKLFQLTWHAHKGFIYDPDSFAKLGEFPYDGEGWGLTHDGHSLIMSDGTNQLRFLNPASFKVERSIKVFDGARPLTQLNELEYIKGEIYANVWQTDRIARINPQDGKLLGWIDLTGLLKPDQGAYQPPVDVLNGIAYDEKENRLYVTGKLWPRLFEIKLKRKG